MSANITRYPTITFIESPEGVTYRLEVDGEYTATQLKQLGETVASLDLDKAAKQAMSPKTYRLIDEIA